MTEAFSFAPAKWIWAPYGRTLPNTFVWFRREFTVEKPIVSAKGYVLACSRYLCTVNGARVQFGPAPCDPRHEEADPLELTDRIKAGKNRLEFSVLYYGHGDGTWVAGRPGLIYKLEIGYADGTNELIVSDRDTLYAPDEAHPAGIYKRWYLRALQEVFDARIKPAQFEPSFELPGRPDKPSMVNGNSDYLYDASPSRPDEAEIVKRSIPMPTETHVSAMSLAHADIVNWKHDPDDWFRFRRAGSFEIGGELAVDRSAPDEYSFEMPDSGAALTFRMPEGGCGFIDFTIDAPAGTMVEAMVQEGHYPENTHWLDTQFYSWTRFICAGGGERFISYDYECFAWLQLHVRNARGRITIKAPGMLRRLAPVPQADVISDDAKVNRVLSAELNTLKNSAVETFVDGMARERQQYSGDVQHEVTLFSYLYGVNHPLVRRFFESYGEGASIDGFFIDCWPAYDRMNRLSQVQVGLTPWAPILDHSLTFATEYCRYRFESGDRSLDADLIPKFRNLIKFLDSISEDGLLRSENTGSTWVWIDGTCFDTQSDKRCAINLQVWQTLNALRAVLPDTELLPRMDAIKAALFSRYYDEDAGIFRDNLQTGCVSDRTLALALMNGFLKEPEKAVTILAEKPAFLKLSYPANAIWRARALGMYGRTDVILEELRTLWHDLPSVQQNNTLQESWQMRGDRPEEWSHCPMAPGLSIYECFGGLKCEAEGWKGFSVRPCAGGLNEIRFTARTPQGDIRFALDHGTLTLTFPEGVEGSIVLKDGTKVPARSGEPVRI